MNYESKKMQKTEKSYALELYFDYDLERRVLNAWNLFHIRNISSKLIKLGYRPNITLLTSPSPDHPNLQNIIKDIASNQEFMPISLSSMVISSNQSFYSLFLAPTPSESLLQFHLQLCDALVATGFVIPEDFSPGLWVPRCPLAELQRETPAAESFDLVRAASFPVTGNAVELALVEYSSVGRRKLFLSALQNSLEP